jgi:hypothetical protein
LLLQDKPLADSLMRSALPRQAFVERIRDSAVALEIKDQAAFRAYWKKMEAQEGYGGLKGRMAAHDVDKSRIPKAYLFDSTVVAYPGWIVLRHMRR